MQGAELLRQPTQGGTPPWPPCSVGCPFSHPSCSTHFNRLQLQLLASWPCTRNSHGAHLVPTRRLQVSTMVALNPLPHSTYLAYWGQDPGSSKPSSGKGRGNRIWWGKGRVLLCRVKEGAWTHGAKSGHDMVHSCSANISEHWPGPVCWVHRCKQDRVGGPRGQSRRGTW